MTAVNAANSSVTVTAVTAGDHRRPVPGRSLSVVPRSSRSSRNRPAARAIQQREAAQPADHLDVAHRAIAPHHDLEFDFAFDVRATSLIRVVGFHFAQQAWRLDAAPGPKRSAAGAAARSVADANAITFAKARASPRAGTTTRAGSLARRRLR